MFRAVRNPWRLFAQVARHFPRVARRAVIMLGCTSDPRFLSGLSRRMPFVRVCWLRYAFPTYKGPILNGALPAYVFGERRAPSGRVLPGEVTAKGRAMAGRGARARAGQHPCPRDLHHVKWLVAHFTAATETVLDPFAGGGSTLVAAWLHGREAVGIERSRTWARQAAADLERVMAQGRLPLTAARPPAPRQGKLFEGAP
ncbi:DNA methyltransferase [Archangium gephyra]|uniref:DNA methyltransferase n=1 Tax=Archangium gephyra TaxID=48 RepID=UPI0035D48EEA